MAKPNGDYRAGSGTDFRAQKSLREMNGSLSQQTAATDRAINRELAALRQQKAYQSAAGTKTVVPENTRAVPGAMDRPSPVRANRQLVPADQVGRLRAAAPVPPPAQPAPQAARKAVDEGLKPAAAATEKAAAGSLRGFAGRALETVSRAGASMTKASVPVEMLLHSEKLGDGTLYKDPTQIPGARRATPDELQNFDANGTPLRSAATPPAKAATAQSSADAARIARNEEILAAAAARDAAAAPTGANAPTAQEVASAYGVRPDQVSNTSQGGVYRVDGAKGLRSPLFTNTTQGAGSRGGYMQSDSAPTTPAPGERDAAVQEYLDVVEQQAQVAESQGMYGRARTLRAEGALSAMQERGTNGRSAAELAARAEEARLTREAAAAKAKTEGAATRDKNVWDAEKDLAKQAADGNKDVRDQLMAQYGDEEGAATYARLNTQLQGVRMRAGNIAQTGVIQPDTIFHKLFGGEAGKPMSVDSLTKPQLETLSVLASDSPLGKNLSMIDPALYAMLVELDAANQDNSTSQHMTDSAVVGAGVGVPAAALAGLKMGGLRGAAVGAGAGLVAGAANYFFRDKPDNALAPYNLDDRGTDTRLRKIYGN